MSFAVAESCMKNDDRLTSVDRYQRRCPYPRQSFPGRCPADRTRSRQDHRSWTWG